MALEKRSKIAKNGECSFKKIMCTYTKHIIMMIITKQGY